MKSGIICFLLMIVTSVGWSQNYSELFDTTSLRLDFIHAGQFDTEEYYLHKMSQLPWYSGPKDILIDPLEVGMYRLTLIQNGKTIYTKGYSTLFEEWQTTKEAKSEKRSFEETQYIPMPKGKVVLKLETRDSVNNFKSIYEMTLNPDSVYIEKGPRTVYDFEAIRDRGYYGNKVDIVILPDGFAREQKDSFNLYAYNFMEKLLDCPPFNEHKDDINFYTVWHESEEIGADLPGEDVWVRSYLDASFYTFGSERYLMTYSVHKVNDMASSVPFDQIIILSNTEKYGGGGVYNYYSITSALNQYSPIVFLHEFGHAFAGLGDEYYDSEVAYEDFTPKTIEPIAPNLTTLVNFEAKWKHLADDVPIPTPDDKRYRNKTGAFEGGGYESKGVYRPEYNCYMKALNAGKFCKVCSDAIEKTIQYYCNQKITD